MRDYQIDALIAAATSGALVLLSLGAFLLVLWRRMRDQQELRRALLARLSGEELSHLIASPEGREWLRAVLGGGNDRRAGLERAMTLLFGSAGCALAGAALHSRPSLALGMVGFAAGLGQLATVLWLARSPKAGGGGGDQAP